jgi:hypothetical protein
VFAGSTATRCSINSCAYLRNHFFLFGRAEPVGISIALFFGSSFEFGVLDGRKGGVFGRITRERGGESEREPDRTETGQSGGGAR